MKSRMNKLMSLCLVAMMGTTFIPQPIQAEEVGEFEEFEEATVEFEEATFEEESNQVAESSVESSRKTPVLDTFDDGELRYQVTGADTVEVIGFLREPSSSVLTRLFIPPTVVHKSQTYRITSIGESAFAGCTSLMSITLPNSLKTIEESAFKGCIGIRKIELPEGLKTIGDSAFKDCILIQSIDLPEGLITIGDSAFALGENAADYSFPLLGFINIPSSVNTLGAIFGDKSPFGKEATLVFQGEKFPEMKDGFFSVISEGNNKPIIYFPNTAMENYVGKGSPFVEEGLINPDYFDSSKEAVYKTIKLCPGDASNFPIYRQEEYEKRKFEISDSNVVDVEVVPAYSSGLITAKSIGEAVITFTDEIDGQVMVSTANKIKVKVDHDYVWQIEKWPTKDQPGSMFQYCLGCQDKKASVPIPPTGGGSTGGGSGGGSTGGSTSGGSGGGSSTGGGSTIDPNAPTPQVENAVYRAYNSSNGEHLYTTNYEEFKVITKNGWDDEGIAFMSELKEKGQAVYRVYNPNNGLHHYTTDVNEKNALVSLGWNDEGVSFYTSKNPKDTPVYRVYNENDSNHHYTMDANEALALISMGWKNEGIAFFTTPMK